MQSKIPVVFSSEVVPATLLVISEPRSKEPRGIAIEILEPHRLTLRQGPGGTLLVVRSPRPKSRDATPAPANPGARDPAPASQDVPSLPQVTEHVDVNDRIDVVGVGTRAFSFEPSAVQEIAGGMENVLQTLRILPTVAPVGDEEGNYAVRLEAYRRRFDRLLVQRLENEAERESRLRDHVIPPDLPQDHSLLERRPTIVPESAGRGNAAGLELLVRREGRHVSGWLAYGLGKPTRELLGRTVPFDFDRRHTLNAAVEIRPWSNVRTALTWQAASGFPVTPVLREVMFGRTVRIDGTVDPLFRTFRTRDGVLTTGPNFLLRRLATYNADRTSGYSRADGRITYSTRGHWEFYGEVINIFNRRNHAQIVRENDGTSIGTAEYTLDVNETFGRMFTYGLRVKF